VRGRYCMPVNDLVSSFERAARWIDAYYREPGRYPVLSQVAPGDIVRALPDAPPEQGEPFDAIFDDFERIVLPGITHWNHPRFFAYFAISATPVTVIAEALAAALDVNAMLWRTSPAATELEDVVTGWLRELLGLDAGLHGIIYDTASIGGFTALAAAREALQLEIRERGMAARPDLPALRVYLTEHTHSHIEKAAIALGIGRENVVRVPVDDAFRMRPEALDRMLAEDRARGIRPMCVVATEFRHLLAGCEHADSLVLNPHKWLFVPVDLSVLYVRDLDNLRRAFSLVAEYLQTSDGDVHNYMDYGLQLGRRFRALKFWFALRHLGVAGMRERLRAHIALAQRLAGWIEAESGWDVLAPHPLSVVCFRHTVAGLDEEALDVHNLAVVDRVNATGEAFLSSTRLHGRVALRIAIGNERTTESDVAAVWKLLRDAALSR
jgi:aromatic-L-amino-acid/L-tryptophan decarboxylase